MKKKILVQNQQEFLNAFVLNGMWSDENTSKMTKIKYQYDNFIHCTKKQRKISKKFQ